ncbi:MAG TPA: LCP family protein [Streptosporangiaceae bacterium]|nr:LCP family protein [Streptosporangiaceae bacterium]
MRETGPAWRTVLGWLAVSVAFVLVVGSLAAYLKFRAVWDSISRIDVVGLGQRPPQLSSAVNILLIGSDSRAGPNRQFGAGITGQRSDTVIILHITPDGRSAVVLSIPRDSVVPVLSCPPEPGALGQPAQPGQVEQINATFARGGPGCLWKTIEQTTHLRLDHFIELDFTGFEHVIDDVGGVGICLPFPVSDPLSRLYLSAGRHHVWGAEALAFWRARYIGEGSDLQRIQRDQFLMASVLQGVERSDMLASPSRLLSVVTDLASSMTTDSGLDLSTLTGIASSMRQLRPANVQFIELPTVDYGPNPSWVTWPPGDAQLFAAIARDRAVPPAVASPGPAQAPPVRRGGIALDRSAATGQAVRVLNGSGIVGIAQQAAQAVTGQGMRVIGIGTAASSAHESSVIEYSSAADLPAATRLQGVLGGMVQRDPALPPGSITAIIGADFALRHPQRPPSSPARRPSPRPAAPARRADSGDLLSKYGGITGSANVCSDGQAFSGPRGGT